MRGAGRAASDEHYIIDLCDGVLGEKGQRQYKGFQFLKGDRGHRLPVDAYYPTRNLVVEYHEPQHSKGVPLWDRRMTRSGVSRGEQRKLYDKRRKDLLPLNGVKLVILDCSMFPCDARGRLKRESGDEQIIRQELRIQVCLESI
ncbi:MAG TPA: hypothetical protein VN823_05370 [Stellaceae bacterium]|nr:hypothetical protein [Stellaceae bacterium]